MQEQHHIIPADKILPYKLMILPLAGNPIFPGIFTPLVIESEQDIRTVNQSLEGDNFIGLILQKDSGDEDDSQDTLYQIGTVAKIVKKINLPDGGLNIFISTIKRFRVVKYLSSTGPLAAAVEYLEETDYDGIEVRALTRSLITEMKQVSKNNPLFTEEMRLNMVNIDQPGRIADFIASIMNVDKQEQQRVLEMISVQERMEQVLVFIKKEQELMKIQQKIQKRINEKIEKNQREYFLREELKAIQQELGIAGDAKSSDYQRYKELFDSLHLNEEAREQVEKELEKFQLMDPNSAEFNVTRNYLEILSALPWNDPVTEDFELPGAQKILD